MSKWVNILIVLSAVVFTNAVASVHHDLQVLLDPAAHRLEVIDRITLPAADNGELEFVLHPGLEPASRTDRVTIERLPERPDSHETDIELTAYRVHAPMTTFEISYGGVINHPLENSGEEYARAFSETPGTIQDDGVYLAGSTYWYPRFGDEVVTFELQVIIPEGWDALSQGKRAIHEPGMVRWEAEHPSDEIFLCAARFTVYQDQAGPVATYAYLRTPDEPLARRYLDTTAAYLEMYRGLIGRYPYGKFALVENFWDTGYGMPSFTLLGPKIIRFPFILHSSYPHEILHNWWGNGVFVDYDTGNWCEGLTAYLADHLIKEQRGQGKEYRRDQLQRYADYVRGERDFPLTEFRSRHSGATQAVGYGKTMMMFHMLRLKLGDERFESGLRTLYEDNLFRRASFHDVQKAFEDASGIDLERFFKAWIDRTGAPTLEIESAKTNNGKNLHLVLRQTQKSEPYPLLVPVAVTMEGVDDAHFVRLPMNEDVLDIHLILPKRPVRVQVDPEFDVFRRLDRREIPPSFGQAFGAEKVLIVLPRVQHEAYRELAENWAASSAAMVNIVDDANLEELPYDRAVWLFGWDNKFNDFMKHSERSVASVISNPDNPENAIAFLATDNPAALPGLGRKLPHYGKYSHLEFEGDAPDNVVKEISPAVGSPLDVMLVRASSPGKLPARQPLATLPPVFSEKSIREHVEFLASDELEGRGCGSEGLNEAASYIEENFRKAGLQTSRMSFEEDCGALHNILGVLPGSNKDYNGQSLVVVAHYDHLGTENGEIHNGADDNASGVAVLLELARITAASERTIIFLATSGEELGTRGAAAYIEKMKEYPAGKIIGCLNIDTVGRLEGRPLLVLGAASADEWRHIVRGAGYVTGVEAKGVTDDYGGSDQKPFIEAGVPAVQFFSGPHDDYHRPGDDPEKLDYPGMVKAATFIKEFVEYLGGRPEPLTSRLEKGEKKPAGPPGGRRVSLGTVPDFAFEGKGVRISGTTPDSPAEQAGLVEGDIVIELAGKPIGNLRDLSALLKTKSPGDSVTVAWMRDGERHEAEVQLKAR